MNLDFLLSACACGCFTAFVCFCFREGMILEFYFRLLDRYLNERPTAFLFAAVAGSNKKTRLMRAGCRVLVFLFKPLGGCSVCLNFWLTGFFFVAFYPLSETRLWFLFPLFQGVSFGALKVLTKTAGL